MNKKIITLSALVTVIGVGILGTTYSYAQGMGESTLVKEIADKFKLNQTEVQAVFDSHKQTREANKQANFEKNLTQLVTEGKITEAQKQLILSKTKELEQARQANKDAFKNMTVEQRKEAINKAKADLETWAKTNNIDLKYLKMGHGFGRHMKMGK